MNNANETKSLPVPSVAEVAGALRTVQKSCLVEVDQTDVRLQVQEDGSWNVHFGAPDYDQDHRGFWGASVITDEDGAGELANVACDLIQQAQDSFAQAQ